MLNEMERNLGMKLRSFTWVGTFTKANRNHFVDFYGWVGEVYVKNEGIFSYTEYYKWLLNKGLCLNVNGMIVGKMGYSDHYNALHKVHIGREKLQDNQGETESYPVRNPNENAVFESAVRLYEMGILSIEQLTTRVKRYIKPDQQDLVLAAVTSSVA